MLRSVVFLVVLIGITGCNKNWSGIVVEKRVYMRGYYVHVPWERKSPVNAYPKPEPYPVDHSRTAATDSVSKNSTPAVASNDSVVNALPPSVGSSSPPASNSATPAPIAQSADNPPPQQDAFSPDTISSPHFASIDTSYSPIAADPILPGTDTSVIADEPPQHDKGFEFPDGTFALTAELGFFSAINTQTIKTKPSSYTAGAAMNYAIPVFETHKLSFSSGFNYTRFSIAQNQVKSSPLFPERHGKERISLVNWISGIALDWHFKKQESLFVQYVSFGLFSETTLFATHVAHDVMRKNDNAQYTFYKKREIGMRTLRNFNYGFTISAAHGSWMLFANYRMSKRVKNENHANDRDLPPVVIGMRYQLNDE